MTRTAVEIVYGPEYDAGTDQRLYKAVGRYSDYSGFGSNGRDHGWVCADEMERMRVVKALRGLGFSPTFRQTIHPQINKGQGVDEPIVPMPVNLPDLDRP